MMKLETSGLRFPAINGETEGLVAFICFPAVHSWYLIQRLMEQAAAAGFRIEQIPVYLDGGPYRNGGDVVNLDAMIAPGWGFVLGSQADPKSLQARRNAMIS